MRILRKLHNLFGRRARLRRLEEEMRTHVEFLVEEGVRSGLSPEEARRRAHLAFGNELATREESEASLGWPVLEAFWQELRLVCRGLVRRPALSLSVVGILALGIGATGALSSLIRAVYLTPLPVPHPEQIHLAMAPDGYPKLVSRPTVGRLASDPSLVGRVAGYSDVAGAALSVDGRPPESVSVQFVTSDFFRVLGVGAGQGRYFEGADDRVGEPSAVVVLSWSFWQRRLGGRAGVVGTELRFNGVPVTVVGIGPKEFRGVSLGNGADAWLPAGMHAPLRISPSCWTISDHHLRLDEWSRVDDASWLSLLLRIPPVAAADAGDALRTAWQPHLDRVLPIIRDAEERAEYTKTAPHLVQAPGGYSHVRGDLRRVGSTLALLVAAMVLATMTNSATLLLLRLLSRIRELGVRLALGAGRWRLTCGALLEGVVLSAVGAAGGLVFCWWFTPVVARWIVPAAEDLVGVDAGLVGALAVVGLVLGLLIGAAPAWAAARLLPQSVLQRRVVGSRESLRLGRGLIVVQLALSVLLVAMAGALALDLRRTLQASYGFTREAVITSRFRFSVAGIEADRQPAVLEHLRAVAKELPQVQSVAFAASGPLNNSTSRSRIWFRGDGVRQPTAGTQHECADPAYFETLGIPLLQGRGLAETDFSEARRVAVISRGLARATFGDSDPVGRRFGFSAEPGDDDDWEIVGVVADAMVNSVHASAPPMFYTPLTQWRNPASCIVVRVAGDAAGIRQSLASRIAAAEPTLLFSEWLTMEERIQRGVRDDRVTVRLTAGFGVLATLLAGIGVFGTLGYLVSSRSHGIAVRLAVGADPGAMWRGVVREAALLGLLGVAGGATCAWILPRWLGAWLTTELGVDWVAVLLAMTVGLLAAVVGSLLPARRAARIDPLVLLKAE